MFRFRSPNNSTGRSILNRIHTNIPERNTVSIKSNEELSKAQEKLTRD